jgi:hypothetical protein
VHLHGNPPDAPRRCMPEITIAYGYRYRYPKVFPIGWP